jgi:membrane protein implicated in regulation of membrane protease activity
MSLSRPAAGLTVGVTSLLTFLSGLVAAACLVLGLVAFNPLLLGMAVLALVGAVLFFRLSRRMVDRYDGGNERQR